MLNGCCEGPSRELPLSSLSLSEETSSISPRIKKEKGETKEEEEKTKTSPFRILSACGRARHGVLWLAHGAVETPVFMPVGTQGTMKGLPPEELVADDCQILLANTYHLGHRPGDELIRRAGGLHRWMHWPRPILTDSGGFQMVSLGKLMAVDERGVEFQSPHTGERTLLTPERCIQMQENIGADIAMQLDHVVPSLTRGPPVEEAMERSIRWLDRCLAAKTLSDERQALFPIVQGGLDLALRERCVREMVPRARVGIAIGGLSGGEAKDVFWRVVAHCCALIPPSLPRYVMGVGWPVDLVVASLLGADMFDCVWPTRTARFGTAIVRRGGELKLRAAQFKNDPLPIDPDCECSTCRGGYSRAAIHALFGDETVAAHLISAHNIHHQLDLMRRLRRAIDAGRVDAFLAEFLREQFGAGKEPEKSNLVPIPQWVRDALRHAGFGAVIDAVGEKEEDEGDPLEFCAEGESEEKNEMEELSEEKGGNVNKKEENEEERELVN